MKQQGFPRSAVIVIALIVGLAALAGLNWMNTAATEKQIPAGHSADDGHNH